MSLSFWIDLINAVQNVIESWRPRGCKTEKDFEQSLVTKLKKEFKKQTIQTQCGSGRQRVDVVVDQKVPIELKKDFKTTAALQRTIGQLEQYLKDWNQLILFLCGEVSADLLKSLKDYAQDKTALIYERVIIIVK